MKTLARFLIILFSVTAFAADPQPVMPKLRFHGVIPANSEHSVKHMATLYLEPNGAELRKVVKAALEKAVDPITANPNPFKLETETYSIGFRSDARSSDGEILRFLIGGEADPYSTRLPGLRTLNVVVLSHDVGMEQSATYAITRLQNPLSEQIPKLFQKFDIGKVATSLEVAAPPDLPLYVWLYEVPLPHRRSTITFKETISEHGSAYAIRQATAALKKSISAREGRESKCVSGMASSLSDAIDAYFEKRRTLTSLTAAQRKALLDDVDDSNLTSLDEAYSTTVAQDICSSLSPSETALVLDVEKRFRGIIGKTTKAEREHTLTNTPAQHVALGIIGGAFVGDESGEDRVKVNDAGQLAADPLQGGLSLAVAHFHPRSFDPTSASMSRAERFSLFGGGVISPEPGLAVGASFTIIRGLSLVGGYSAMRVKTARSGDAVGQAPADVKDPFEGGWSYVPFVGLGYKFE